MCVMLVKHCGENGPVLVFFLCLFSSTALELEVRYILALLMCVLCRAPPRPQHLPPPQAGPEPAFSINWNMKTINVETLNRCLVFVGETHGLRVRGSSYLRDGRKISAGPSFGTLLRADLFRVDGARYGNLMIPPLGILVISPAFLVFPDIFFFLTRSICFFLCLPRKQGKQA